MVLNNGQSGLCFDDNITIEQMFQWKCYPVSPDERFLSEEGEVTQVCHAKQRLIRTKQYTEERRHFRTAHGEVRREWQMHGYLSSLRMQRLIIIIRSRISERSSKCKLDFVRR